MELDEKPAELCDEISNVEFNNSNFVLDDVELLAVHYGQTL